MKILIIGGTIFVGRHFVESARQHGHELTLFHRGKHNPDLFPEVTTIRGDRDGELAKLSGQKWDAVLDTCGYIPRIVRASANFLRDCVDRYVFISSISVYPDFTKANINETEPLITLDNPSVEEVTGETYGGLKALCEQVVEEIFPNRALNIRPGLIVGPHDPSDRFTYWPYRLAHGGEVIAPGNRQRTIQFIDVRDLADWLVAMIERKETGVYNATGPKNPLSMGEFLLATREATQVESELIWMDDDFLLEQKVGPWVEMPLWIPGENESVNCQKAIAAGLTFSPLTATIRDTLLWDSTRPIATVRRAGLDPEKEMAIITAWKSKNGSV